MMFFKLGLRFAAANRQRLRMKFFGVIHVCILLQKQKPLFCAFSGCLSMLIICALNTRLQGHTS